MKFIHISSVHSPRTLLVITAFFVQVLKAHFPGVLLVKDVAELDRLPKETDLLVRTDQYVLHA